MDCNRGVVSKNLSPATYFNRDYTLLTADISRAVVSQDEDIHRLSTAKLLHSSLKYW